MAGKTIKIDYKTFAKMKWNKNNMFPDETAGQEAMDILAKYIMEQDNISYLVSYSANAGEVNTEVVRDILYRLRKKTFLEKLIDLF